MEAGVRVGGGPERFLGGILVGNIGANCEWVGGGVMLVRVGVMRVHGGIKGNYLFGLGGGLEIMKRKLKGEELKQERPRGLNS